MRVLASIKYTNHDHSFCPRNLSTEEEIDRELFRKPLHPFIVKLRANEIRFELSKLRKDDEEKKSIANFILGELGELEQNVPRGLESPDIIQQRITHLKGSIEYFLRFT